MRKQVDAVRRNLQGTSQQKSADGVRRYDDRHERQKRIVDEGAAVNRHFVEAKGKRDEGCENCVQSEEGRERDEDPD